MSINVNNFAVQLSLSGDGFADLSRMGCSSVDSDNDGIGSVLASSMGDVGCRGPFSATKGGSVSSNFYEVGLSPGVSDRLSSLIGLSVSMAGGMVSGS